MRHDEKILRKERRRRHERIEPVCAVQFHRSLLSILGIRNRRKTGYNVTIA